MPIIGYFQWRLLTCFTSYLIRKPLVYCKYTYYYNHMPKCYCDFFSYVTLHCFDNITSKEGIWTEVRLLNEQNKSEGERFQRVTGIKVRVHWLREHILPNKLQRFSECRRPTDFSLHTPSEEKLVHWASMNYPSEQTLCVLI